MDKSDQLSPQMTALPPFSECAPAPFAPIDAQRDTALGNVGGDPPDPTRDAKAASHSAEAPGQASAQWQVQLPAQGLHFVAAPQQSLLLAALAAGIALPSACRNGTCRACLSVLQAGEIGYLIAWPGVSAEEKEQGLFLPCVACARSDLRMQPLRPLGAGL